MEVYRIYRKNLSTNRFEETSYCGKKKLITHILKALNKSKINLFIMKRVG